MTAPAQPAIWISMVRHLIKNGGKSSLVTETMRVFGALWDRDPEAAVRAADVLDSVPGARYRS